MSSTRKLDDSDHDVGPEPRLEDSGVRRTGMRPAARRPESQPPVPSLPPSAVLPTATRTTRVPKPSSPPPRPDPITPTQHRVAALEAALEETRRMFTRELGALTALRARLEAPLHAEDLDALPSDAEARLASLETRVDAIEGDDDDLVRELRALRVRAAGEALGRSRRWMEIERRLASVEEGAEAARLRMQLDRVARRLTAIEQGSGAVERRVHALEEGPELARLRMRLDRISRRLDALEVDDLTQLRGVGPRTAARLRAMGVRTFAQLAGLGEADVTKTAAELGVAPSRVAGWVADAAALASSG